MEVAELDTGGKVVPPERGAALVCEAGDWLLALGAEKIGLELCAGMFADGEAPLRGVVVANIPPSDGVGAGSPPVAPPPVTPPPLLPPVRVSEGTGKPSAVQLPVT